MKADDLDFNIATLKNDPIIIVGRKVSFVIWNNLII